MEIYPTQGKGDFNLNIKTISNLPLHKTFIIRCFVSDFSRWNTFKIGTGATMLKYMFFTELSSVFELDYSGKLEKIMFFFLDKLGCNKLRIFKYD